MLWRLVSIQADRTVETDFQSGWYTTVQFQDRSLLAYRPDWEQTYGAIPDWKQDALRFVYGDWNPGPCPFG